MPKEFLVMMSQSPQLSVVLPAYEEAANLRALLPRIREVADQLGIEYEVIVVDAKERRDETPDVCLENGVICIHRTEGELYGHAVRSGIRAAQGSFSIFMDADGSHNPQTILDLWQKREQADLVIASRYVPDGKTENPAILILFSLIVNVVFRLILGLKCMDVSNSYRLYRTADLKALHLTCNHFDIVEDILVLLSFSRPSFRTLEVPCTFEKRKAGKTKRKLLLFVLAYLAVLMRLLRLKQKAKRDRQSQREHQL